MNKEMKSIAMRSERSGGIFLWSVLEDGSGFSLVPVPVGLFANEHPNFFKAEAINDFRNILDRIEHGLNQAKANMENVQE